MSTKPFLTRYLKNGLAAYQAKPARIARILSSEDRLHITASRAELNAKRLRSNQAISKHHERVANKARHALSMLKQELDSFLGHFCRELPAPTRYKLTYGRQQGWSDDEYIQRSFYDEAELELPQYPADGPPATWKLLLRKGNESGVGDEHDVYCSFYTEEDAVRAARVIAAALGIAPERFQVMEYKGRKPPRVQALRAICRAWHLISTVPFMTLADYPPDPLHRSRLLCRIKGNAWW